MLQKLALAGASVTSNRARQVIEMLAQKVANYAVTPMVTFEVMVGGRRRRVHLKLEGESPWGSIKGRTAIGLVASVAPLLTEQSRLVESTSGNLGVAMAGLTQEMGIPFTAVTDERLPARMNQLIRSNGADLITVDLNDRNVDPLTARIRTAAQLSMADQNVIWTNQYENPANPAIHELWTGPELLRQAPTTEAIVVGASTGGTLAGLARAARSAAPGVKVVGADVEGSRVFGGPSGSRILTGIGASIPSHHLVGVYCDAVQVIPSWHGIVQCRQWLLSTGLPLGGSSGIVLAAAVRCFKADPDLTTVTCVCPDLGENYTKTIYNNEWVSAQRLGVQDGYTWPELLLPLKSVGSSLEPA